jgi:hypothetical protein
MGKTYRKNKDDFVYDDGYIAEYKKKSKKNMSREDIYQQARRQKADVGWRRLLDDDENLQ